MTALGIARGPVTATRHRIDSTTAHNVRWLQAFSIILFLFPSDLVFKPMGAQAYPAGLMGMALFAGWTASTFLGFHDPRRFRYPTRAALALFASTSLASWALVPTHFELSSPERLSADRWIMLVASVAGVVLVASEGLRTLEHVRRVLRALVIGGAVCGVVASLQFWMKFDATTYLRMALPGFTVNSEFDSVISRGYVSRVTGTTMHPIELGVVCGMLLPLAIALALHDKTRGVRQRWLPVALIAVGIPVSVSRSALLALTVAVGLFVALLPPVHRAVALALSPVALVAVFISTPGYLRTMTEFIGAGASDPSVSTRLDDYPMVERMVRLHPWFGSGGGTYFASNALTILDNQYLKGFIELGLIGMTGLACYLVVPLISALTTYARSTDPETRSYCAALAGSAGASAVCSATFDSMSFNTYVGLYSLVVGLTGALWVISQREARRPRDNREADETTLAPAERRAGTSWTS